MEKPLNELTDAEIDLEIKYEKNQILKETSATNTSKKEFIKTIKSGLGPKIKETGNKITIVEKTKFQKFKLWLKKIFTRF